jgi:hypothetical protein
MSLTSSTARSRHCRQRRRNGLVQLTIEVNEVGIEMLLANHGLISRHGSEDRDATARALERLLQLLIAADAAQYRE